jgi:hypothetical protein
MPQLDPVLIFFQSFSLITFYLIFYFLFFRKNIFPFFFVNFKLNYYLFLKFIRRLLKLIDFTSQYLFALKFYRLVIISLLNILTLNFNIQLFLKIDDIFRVYTLFSNFSNLFLLNNEQYLVEDDF